MADSADAHLLALTSAQAGVQATGRDGWSGIECSLCTSTLLVLAFRGVQIGVDLEMPIRREPDKWLRKKAKAGARAYPLGTVAFYGPDDDRASKVVAAVIECEGGEAEVLQRWIVADGDARRDGTVLAEVTAFLKEHGVRSVGMIDKIIGCPHEEGKDYPEGEACPACSFWAGRDRWAGVSIT